MQNCSKLFVLKLSNPYISSTPIMDFELGSCPMELLILSTIQSNNLEYTILAKASLLRAADSGSKDLVMVSSRVTIIRLQRESSKAFGSHMKSSAAVCRWNWDFSSLGSDESISLPFLNSMFPK
uniref:Uncharacterized protein n=1 Tax=Opuntia streptacantha TaxID=393608 RepID=A0A7C9DQU1_OPUST